MNPDPDYSAAYVILDTRCSGIEGHGLTFTIGRGNDICCARDRGDAASRRRPRARLGEGESRPVLASSHRRQPAALDRPGQGRHASCHRRGGQCRLGPAGQGSRQAGVAAGRRDEPGRDRQHRRLPLPHRRADARRGARHPAQGRAGQGRAHRRRSSARAMPATRPRPAGSAIPTTSCAGFARKRSMPASTTSR